MRGAGRVAFAGILLIIIGVINVIYGIGALDDANYFVNDTRFVLDNLNTLGWVLIIVGVIQLTGRILVVERIDVRAGDRDHRRHPRRAKRSVLDRRGEPLVVALRVRAVHLRRLRNRGLRRGRASRRGPGAPPRRKRESPAAGPGSHPLSSPPPPPLCAELRS